MSKFVAPRSVVNLRRAYFECRYGQLHVRTGFPSTGGFDEHTPLVLLHDFPRSSRMFVPLLGALGADRSVYAADLPGYGESDAPASRPTVADYAGAIADVIDHLRLRRVDVLGHHAGVAVACELALARAEVVRKLVCIGVPLYSTAEREAFAAAPHPRPPAADGSHASAEWQRVLAARGPGVTLEQTAASFAEAIASGPAGWWGEGAVSNWPGHERLGRLAQPLLVIRPKDALWEASGRAERLLRGAEWQSLAEAGEGLVEVAPDLVATRVRSFLDR
jgi:pimeloyl-ACP methyl ester carboxylesterase